MNEKGKKHEVQEIMAIQKNKSEEKDDFG